MSMKERLHTGELYLPDDPEIVSLQQECLERLYEYNATRPHESENERLYSRRCLHRSEKAATLNLLSVPIGVDTMYILAITYMPIST